MKYVVIGLALLVGCAHAPAQTAEQVAAEVQKTADKLEKALDVAQEKSAPYIDAIDVACEVAAPESEPCKVAGEAIEKFALALDKAQFAIDEYRKFTGTFADAAKALAAVLEAGAAVVQAAKP